MSTKDLILAELDRLAESELEEVYRLIREFASRPPTAIKKPGLFAQLREIRIDAPEDFSRRLRDHRRGPDI